MVRSSSIARHVALVALVAGTACGGGPVSEPDSGPDGDSDAGRPDADADSDGGPDADEDGDVLGDVVLSDRLRLPETDPAFAGVEVLADRLVFELSAPPSFAIEPGDLVAGSAGPGYLRRAVRVESGEASLTVHTEAAALTDAIRDGRVALDIRDAEPAGAKVESTIEIDEYVLGGDGNGVRLVGRVTARMDVRLVVEIADWRVRRAEVVLLPSLSERLEAVAEIGYAAEARGEVDVAEHVPGVPFRFAIGALPVVGELRFGLVLGHEASIGGSASVTAGFAIEATGELGMRYDDGEWTDVRSVNVTAEPILPSDTAEASAAAAVRVFLRPEVRVELYGVGGPTFAIERGVELRVTADTESDCFAWSVDETFALSASLEATVPVIDESFSHEVARLEDRRRIASGDFECDDECGEDDVVCEGVCHPAGSGSCCQPHARNGLVAWRPGDPDCCGDLVCAHGDESALTCPGDCPVCWADDTPIGPCGDGECTEFQGACDVGAGYTGWVNVWEYEGDCPIDCYCGNGSCEWWNDETRDACPADCS